MTTLIVLWSRPAHHFLGVGNMVPVFRKLGINVFSSLNGCGVKARPVYRKFGGGVFDMSKEVYDCKIEITSTELKELDNVMLLARKLIQKGYGGDVRTYARMMWQLADQIKNENGKTVYRKICDDFEI